MSLLPSVIDRNDCFVEPPPEWPKDVLLNYEFLDGERWFRLRRQTQEHGKKIVYIHVRDPAFVPLKSTDPPIGPWIIDELRKVAWRCWGHWWTTLTISHGERGELVFEKDDFKPPYIPAELILPSKALFPTEHIAGIDEQELHSSLNIRFLHVPNHGYLSRDPNFVWKNQSDALIPTSEPEYPSEHYVVLKSEPFFTNAPFMAQEAKVYKYLTQRNCPSAPRVVGYVCEENFQQINGLLLEKLDGTVPVLEDYEACAAALTKLHEAGIVHNQLTINNIIMTDEGAKFLDFSEAHLDLDVLPDAEKSFGPKAKELWQYLLREDQTELTKHDLEEMKRNDVDTLENIFVVHYNEREKSKLEDQDRMVLMMEK